MNKFLSILCALIFGGCSTVYHDPSKQVVHCTLTAIKRFHDLAAFQNYFGETLGIKTFPDGSKLGITQLSQSPCGLQNKCCQFCKNTLLLVRFYDDNSMEFYMFATEDCYKEIMMLIEDSVQAKAGGSPAKAGVP